jgi:hypothetical protein
MQALAAQAPGDCEANPRTHFLGQQRLRSTPGRARFQDSLRLWRARFRKRFAGMENVDDLHFAGRVNPMDVDHAALHHEESSAGIPLTKEVFVFLKISYCGKRADFLDIGGRKS